MAAIIKCPGCGAMRGNRAFYYYGVKFEVCSYCIRKDPNIEQYREDAKSKIKKHDDEVKFNSLMKTLFTYGNLFINKKSFSKMGKNAILDYFDEEKKRCRKADRPFKWRRVLKINTCENGYILELGRLN